jgi:hypothetical protein
LIVGLTDVRVGIMTGDAVIEQKISVLPPKSDMRVNDCTRQPEGSEWQSQAHSE